MLTAFTISDTVIQALMDEAGSVGDLAMVDICRRALNRPTRHGTGCKLSPLNARKRCAEVVNYAKAQENS